MRTKNAPHTQTYTVIHTNLKCNLGGLGHLEFPNDIWVFSLQYPDLPAARFSNLFPANYKELERSSVCRTLYRIGAY